MATLGPQKIKELKAFCEVVKSNPQILHSKDLEFFKDFLIHFGATIPEPKPTKTEEKKAEEPQEEQQPEEKEPEEEPDEPDTELVPEDNDPPLEMGDESKEVTDEMFEIANNAKMEAMEAFREKRYPESIELFTKAIKNNPKSGILYASRAQALLDMKKPNAAITDTTVAIRINPDSAKPYKVRARAHRALGHYEQALRDIQLGQKLDWDEASHKLENEWKPRIEKIMAKKKRQQEREEAKRKKQAHSHSHGSHSHSHSHEDENEDMPDLEGMPDMGGMPFSGMPNMGGMPFGGMPNMGGMPFGGGNKGMPGVTPELIQQIMSDPELSELFTDPSLLAKAQEIMSDPSKVSKYKDDPKLQKILSKLSKFS